MAQQADQIRLATARATASMHQAYRDLTSLIETAEAERSRLEEQMQAAAATIQKHPDFDEDGLRAFFEKPYVVLPIPGTLDRFWIVVPRFLNMRAGWAVRETESFRVFEASRYLQLLGMIPEWLAAELDFPSPSMRAIVEGLQLTVLEGDPVQVATQLGGQKTISKRQGNVLFLRPGARFAVLRQIIREFGFLPYAPTPVPESLQRPHSGVAQTEEGSPAFQLRAHQQAAYETLLERGAISLFAHAQAGKSYVPIMFAADMVGPKLILAPRRALLDQWRARLELYLTPEAAGEVVLSTYQGAAKHLAQRWSLVVFDEAHHLPADFALEAATNLQADARIALSASPWREDGNEDLIPLLGGFPVGADWPVEPHQRPRVTVWISKDDEEKQQLVLHRARLPITGKTLIFTQRLEPGRLVAEALGIPLVYSKTKEPRQVIADHQMVVVSPIADEGLSVDGIARVLEIDFLGASRMQAAQRAGRLGNASPQDGAGEHHIFMTQAEFHKFHRRLLAYVSAGYEITVETFDGRAAERRSAAPEMPKPRTQKVSGLRTTDPDVQQWMASKSVSLRINQALQAMPARSATYTTRVLSALKNQPFSAEELADAWGLTDAGTRRHVRGAMQSLSEARLLTAVGDRYQLNQSEIDRLLGLEAAAGSSRKGRS